MGWAVACGVLLAGCWVCVRNARAYCLRAEAERDEAVGLVRAWLESEAEELCRCDAADAVERGGHVELPRHDIGGES